MNFLGLNDPSSNSRNSSGLSMRRSESGQAIEERQSLLSNQSSLGRPVQVTLNPSSPQKGKKLKDEDDDNQPKLNLREFRPKEPFLETDIKPDDTLSSLSLKYNVSVPELKRLNNIIRDQEFYALKRIKIPLKPLNLLSDEIQKEFRMRNSEKPKSRNDSNAGWLVEHFQTPPTGEYNTSEVNSPAILSDGSEEVLVQINDETEINLPIFNNKGPVDFHADKSKEVKKTQKLLKSVDRNLAVIKSRHDAFMSSIIQGDSYSTSPAPVASSSATNLRSGLDDSDDENFLGQSDEDEFLLLPPRNNNEQKSTAMKVLSPSFATSNFSCCICIALIVISVCVILWFAAHEYEIIENERIEVNHSEDTRDGEKGLGPLD